MLHCLTLYNVDEIILTIKHKNLKIKKKIMATLEHLFVGR